MSFLTAMLKKDLENIGKSAEPYISDTIIEIMNNEENSKKMINSIIKKFLEIIEKKLQNDNETKIKLLSIVKDVMNKDADIYKNVYKENIELRQRIKDLEEQNIPVVQAEVAQAEVAQAEVIKQKGGSVTDVEVKNINPDVAKTKEDITKGLNQFKTDTADGMKAFSNITNGLKNIKDVKDIPLLGIILSIIISLSEQKIREDICSRLHNNKDKIVESAIRVFVKEITDNNYINDIEIAEVYDSIINNIKKMENVKNPPKPKNSIMNKLKESTTNIDLGFGRELNKLFKKKGGKKFTHKKKSKQSKKSKKYNHKSRTNRL